MVVNMHRHFRMRRRTRIASMRYRVFLDEREVTKRTFYVDSRRGIVRRFKENEEGQVYVDPVTHKAAREELRGKVRLVRRKEVAA